MMRNARVIKTELIKLIKNKVPECLKKLTPLQFSPPIKKEGKTLHASSLKLISREHRE